MNTQFCRVGKIRPNLSKTINLKDLERRIANFVDDTSKVYYSEEIKSVI
jgi:hypothetical protein